ncbi:MAG TPA: carboxypeptidase-like regulatory domain-containing protein, partial [Candidatus Thermoplasmatota archaeon]|nr:carboxypeptidase-like regulatory domain-containing protein [Candidatus Thermoplasmatota archaeon]
MRPFLAVLLVAVPAVALAGCAGGGGDGAGDPTQDVDFDDLDLQATATTGLIRGVVVDSAIRPVGDAVVELRGAETPLQTRSNAEGAFGFDQLPPGDYFLTASKPGFVQAQQATQVVAGVSDPPIVKVLLEADPSTAPYVTAYVFDGFLECSVRAVIIGFAACSNGAFVNDRFLEEYEPNGVPDHWQSEMLWESTQAFGEELSLAIDCLSGDPCPDGQVGIARHEGRSPLMVTINRTTSEAFLLGIGQPVTVRVFAFGRQDTDLVNDDQVNQQLNSTSGGAVQCVEWPAVFASCMRFGGVGIILQQKFTVYSHEFHG